VCKECGRPMKVTSRVSYDIEDASEELAKLKEESGVD
jgi:hypothetical protein